MLCRESVVFTSIVKHTRQSLGEGYGFNYRVITEQFAGFVPDKVSSIPYMSVHKIGNMIHHVFFRIPDLDFFIPEPRSRGKKSRDPGSGSATAKMIKAKMVTEIRRFYMY
jgi:hypothetical protein